MYIFFYQQKARCSSKSKIKITYLIFLFGFQTIWPVKRVCTPLFIAYVLMFVCVVTSHYDDNDARRFNESSCNKWLKAKCMYPTFIVAKVK